MRVRELTYLPALLLLASCDAASDAPDATAVPAAAECADAGPLRQRVSDDRLRMTEVSSQQTQVVLGSRANFMASLALVAQLGCAVTLPDGDTALEAALEGARAAVEASSFYEQATRWNEANYALAQLIENLVQRLPMAVTE